ncbi:MAG: glycoside hydrolase family 88 protein [Candidatus Neomarinimicrobiota bacterium]
MKRSNRNRNKISPIYLLSGLLVLIAVICLASDKPASTEAWSVRMTESVMQRNPLPWTIDPANEAKWEYTYGLVLKAVLQVWVKTGDQRYFHYVDSYYEHFIDDSGRILTYQPDEYNIDRINSGKPLFNLYRTTGKEKYKKALMQLRQQMQTHPRTQSGGFWHKKIYPHQMWLDGIYMASPFLAEYAQVFNEPTLFDDIAKQIILIEEKTRDAGTGLLYHGWDESRQQAWADPQTGCSSQFWGRAVGWYAMALVDVLDYLPVDHPQRPQIIAILKRLSKAILKVQDPATGLWYQVLDKGGKPGNYLESSASCMFVYSLAKGVRQGYLEPDYLIVAQKGYRGILDKFIEIDSTGSVNITQACAVAGLGGKPYRDGSYAYYISTKIATNDPKAVGPFILASLEMELLNNRKK